MPTRRLRGGRRWPARTPSTAPTTPAAPVRVPRAACGSRTSAPARRAMPVHVSAPGTPATPNRRFGWPAHRLAPRTRQTPRQHGRGHRRGRPADADVGRVGKTVCSATRRATGRCSNTTGSGFDTVLAAYGGATLAGLVQVACNDDIDLAGGNRRSRAQVPATAGRRTTCRSAASRSRAAPCRPDAGRGDGGADRPGQRRPSPPPPRSARFPSTAPAWTRGRRRWRPRSRPRRARRRRSTWFRYVAPGDATSSPTPSAATSTPSWPCIGIALGALTRSVQRRHRSPRARRAGNLRSACSSPSPPARPTTCRSAATARTTARSPAAPSRSTSPPTPPSPRTTRSRPRWSPARPRPPARAWTRDRPGPRPASPAGLRPGGAHGLVPLHGAGRRHARRGHDRQRLRHRPRGYRGTALGALTQVGCADDIDFQSGNVRSRLQFGVTAGQTTTSSSARSPAPPTLPAASRRST